MTEYAFRIVNVFTAGEALSGNPLCVFEDARGLDDATLQALALQFNLSETTFILPSEKASARVRIFTPAYEMPFAGHPTLGTAFVLSAMRQSSEDLTLEMKAGVIPVCCIATAQQRWQLQANTPSWRDTGVAPRELAAMLGLKADDIGDSALWVNAGKEQLIVPLTSRDAVDRCDAAHIKLGALQSVDGHSMAYVFHDAGQEVYARFFFPGKGAILEDPATGSACANLGGWFLAHQAALPLSKIISQGQHVGRPSQLYLDIDASRNVQVAGDVVELARGRMTL